MCSSIRVTDARVKRACARRRWSGRGGGERGCRQAPEPGQQRCVEHRPRRARRRADCAVALLWHAALGHGAAQALTENGRSKARTR
eukprot:19268-Pleurochrysis_carterae.AAC.2